MDKLTAGQRCPKCGSSIIVFTYNAPASAVSNVDTGIETSPKVVESVGAKCICNYMWNLAPMDTNQ